MKSDSWIVIALTCAIFAQICRATRPYALQDDEILSLPGQPAVSFKQYGGYISVDDKQDRALFYYFVEAESNPDTKPLVLWLNGGPGCSSLGTGAFYEHGPFRASGVDTLTKNDYSWNKEANMLYLESPAGVGYSYSANASFYTLVNDTITAQDNFKFVEEWFLKYPEYNDRDFYITGESYAGHYVPQLADLIIKSGLKLNLKGIALGNAVLEFETNFNAGDEFYWSHGLTSDSTYKLAQNICNNSRMWREQLTGPLSPACSKINDLLNQEIPQALDGYDVTLDSCASSSSSSSSSSGPGKSQLVSMMKNPLIRPMIHSFSATDLNQTKGNENIDLCEEDKVYAYLNNKAVQQAFHAKLVGVTGWNACEGIPVNYDRRNFEIPTIGVVGSLVSSGIPVLIYSGDQDSVIPLSGSRTLADALAEQLHLNTTVPYRAWFLDKQIGGWTQVYGDNILTFASIRGAGHLAPFSSPERSLALFSAFLTGKPLPAA